METTRREDGGVTNLPFFDAVIDKVAGSPRRRPSPAQPAPPFLPLDPALWIYNPADVLCVSRQGIHHNPYSLPLVSDKILWALASPVSETLPCHCADWELVLLLV